MEDTISRKAAIEALADYIHNVDKVMGTGHLTADDCKDAAASVFEELPSAQPGITLESAIDYLHSIGWMQEHDRTLTESAQPEPLSDAYMNAVWTWLIDYQIKAAELKGRYTPYEVLSWVANDWRKEHERLN